MSDVRLSAQLNTPHPLVQALEEYLRSRNAFPAVSSLNNAPSGLEGQFRYPIGGNSPGEIRLAPGYSEASYGHELTHAADRQMRNQFQSAPFGPPTRGEDQFQDAYRKILQSGSQAGQALQMADLKNPLSRNAYRMSPEEVPAFAIDNAISPAQGFPIGGHSSSTTATEFAILLDLAKRAAQK
jgi:hypothetical protein